MSTIFALTLNAQMTPAQKVADFTSMSQFYVRHYTPANWKIEQFGFDLSDLRPWLPRVLATKDDLEYYDVVIDYLASLRDGHISYTLPSNFQAYLRFDVDIYDGKTLIEFISPTFNQRDFPIEVGDEVVSVDGVTSEEWIRRFTKYGENANPRATRRQAADYITFRPQVLIPTAPNVGETARVVIRKPSGEEATYDIPWQKFGVPLTKLPPTSGPRLAGGTLSFVRDRSERLQEIGRKWGIWMGPRQAEDEALTPVEQEIREAQVGQAHPVDQALIALGSPAPLYDPPAGFRLRLGARQGDQFVSGTFPVDGQTVGWIRVYTFSPSNTAAALTQFRQEITEMQQSTSALVIDVMHNPGGNLCYAVELMRFLAQRPFWGVGYWVKPTQTWKNFFDNRVLNITANTPQWEREALQSYSTAFNAAFERGEETGVFPICTSSLSVQPQDVTYTKPVILLTNDFSVSAGDAFPAMFQDAERGKIVGMRTGGLGGNVNSYFSTGVTEASLSITRSLLVRERAFPSPLGMTRFIENAGVQPDVELDIMTREDLITGGQPFVNGWVEEVRTVLPRQ
ncbi:MAG: S41 family peptidase [Bryobacteraceae bacterium]|nr:S41 family peptidase [Bryobacteraceae bacterium]